MNYPINPSSLYGTYRTYLRTVPTYGRAKNVKLNYIGYCESFNFKYQHFLYILMNSSQALKKVHRLHPYCCTVYIFYFKISCECCYNTVKRKNKFASSPRKPVFDQSLLIRIDLLINHSFNRTGFVHFNHQSLSPAHPYQCWIFHWFKVVNA